MTNERPRNEGSVLKNWISGMPWKMQSVLLSGLRGPDERRCPELKKLVRFIRAATQNDAGVTAEDSYLDISDMPTLKDLLREVEYLSMHYVTHLLYALQIVACKCPDGNVSEQAGYWYEEIVNDLHLTAESHEDLDRRLG